MKEQRPDGRDGLELSGIEDSTEVVSRSRSREGSARQDRANQRRKGRRGEVESVEWPLGGSVRQHVSSRSPPFPV